MEYIKTREEIAAAINFGKYPVVLVEDLAKCRTDYGWNLGKVKIKTDRGYYVHADLYIFKDKKELTTASYGGCLSERFGLDDICEMAKNANAPELKPNGKFVLVMIGNHDGKKCGSVTLIDTGAFHPHYSDPLEIVDAFMGKILISLGEKF